MTRISMLAGIRRPSVTGRRAGMTVLLLGAVALTACAGGHTTKSKPATELPPVTVASPAAASGAGSAGGPSARAATRSPSHAPGAASASPTGTPSAADQAILAVVQQANTEQQQALAQHDPTVMQDTATPAYFQELAQTQRDFQRRGVTAIKLVSFQQGQLSIQGTTAQATTTETWQTRFSDGSTDQSTDLNVYTLVQQGSRWLIAADDHPTAQLRQPAPGTAPAPRAPGGRPASAPGATGSTGPSSPTSPTAPSGSAGAPGADQSRNWAGYAASGGPFTAISGSWTVPTVDPRSALGSADATWVGIGGVTSDDLLQAGTQATVDSPGQVTYSAWVEALPQASRTVPLSVSPGDAITVTLTQQAGGTWQVSIVNQTTGKQYQRVVQYDSSLSSAEWVEEAPAAVSAGVRIVPLDNFGQVQFQHGSATLNGRTVTIAQTGAAPITMAGRGGQLLTQTSALGSDGSGFTITRLAGGGPSNSR